MTNPAWVPDTRPIPPELADEYEHETYPPKPVHFDTIADKLDHATLAQLRAIMHGGIGQPDTTPTQQSDELTDKERAAVIHAATLAIDAIDNNRA
jgi:hypothetical protein